MTTTLSKNTVIENIWSNFYDRLNSDLNATSITITDGTVVTLQKFSSSFDDKTFSQKSDFPVVIVESPHLNNETFTLGKNKLNGTIDIVLYTTQAESADKFASKILDSIETYRDSFFEVGLKDVQGSLDDSDFTMYGKIKTHWRLLRFTYTYRYTSTLK